MYELIIAIVLAIAFWKSIRKLGKVSELAITEGLEIAEEELKVLDLEYRISSQERLAKVLEKIEAKPKILTAEKVKEKLVNKINKAKA